MSVKINITKPMNDLYCGETTCEEQQNELLELSYVVNATTRLIGNCFK